MKTVLFAHGKESGPQGIKINALSRVAQRHGWNVVTPDFRGIDDPRVRVDKLLDIAGGLSGTLILAGSSMGGYVVTAAAARLEPAGLFLMAPAVGLPDYPESDLVPHAKHVVAVHGWDDEIVPADNVIVWARRQRVALTLVPDRHDLQRSLPILSRQFEQLLEDCSHSGRSLVSLL